MVSMAHFGPDTQLISPALVELQCPTDDPPLEVPPLPPCRVCPCRVAARPFPTGLGPRCGIRRRATAVSREETLTHLGRTPRYGSRSSVTLFGTRRDERGHVFPGMFVIAIPREDVGGLLFA